MLCLIIICAKLVVVDTSTKQTGQLVIHYSKRENLGNRNFQNLKILMLKQDSTEDTIFFYIEPDHKDCLLYYIKLYH